MKKSLLFLFYLLCASLCYVATAQTNPGSANLRHRWTFDRGSAVDEVAGVVGEIVGNGTLANNGFVAVNGHMRFPASQIAINTFPALSVEVWCTSVAGANTGWTMLTYFGETIGTSGANCTFLSIARVDNVSMATLEAPNWNGTTGPELDDGRLHHIVYTLNATTITLFINGVQISSASITGSNSLANVRNSLAFLGRGGWTADPNWVGTFHKFSLFDKALTPDEVMFLFQQGAEDNAVITVAKNEITLDGNFFADEFIVTGANLTSPITITTPAGITSIPASLPANTQGSPVYVVWDGTTVVDGNIRLSSGNIVVEIPIKTADDSQCFKPLYADMVNLVDNSGMNSLAFFSGWGTREVSSIINDPVNVYCGASSIAVGNGITSGSGSLNVDVTGRLKPNTMYRVRAMVKTVDGTFQLGVLGWSEGEGDINNVIDTQGEWRLLEFTFTTGNVLRPDVHVLFWNNWQCTGTRSYIDNWEIYEAPEAQLAVSKTTGAFDPEFKNLTFTVTGINLVEQITIQVPAGLTATPSSLPPLAQSAVVTVEWDGVTPVNGVIMLQSTGLTKSIVVKSTAISNHSCFTPMFTDKVNMVVDPFMNDMANFGGWGSRNISSIANNPDSVFCGSHAGRVVGSGSIDVILTGRMKSNTTYLARAMVMTIGGAFQLGAWGMDALTPGDIQDSIDTQGTWMPIVFEFATGESFGAVQGMFFNNFQRSGTRGFIDNWELYEMGGLSVNSPTQAYHKVYVNNRRIITEFEISSASKVSISVFSIQGTLVAQKTLNAQSGRNREELDVLLSSGVYLVRISSEGKNIMQKIIL